VKLRPLSDNIVVARDQVKSVSSVVIAKAVEKTTSGTIISVGPGMPQEDGSYLTPTVKEGDRISFLYFKDRPVYGYTADGRDVIMVRESDIIGVLSA